MDVFSGIGDRKEVVLTLTPERGLGELPSVLPVVQYSGCQRVGCQQIKHGYVHVLSKHIFRLVPVDPSSIDLENKNESSVKSVQHT